MNQDALSALAEFLNAAGWNYSVFLQSYGTPFAASVSSEVVIHSALGATAVVGGCSEVTPAEALAEVKESLTYAGDSGAGPAPQAMQSEHFAELLDTVLAEVGAAVARSTRIERFWLKEGHPAYPVFWDFAFLLRKENEAVVIVGSSSD
ncbi:hypothetical protein [Azospira inquinata]|uniref:Uncharacterized protein n=1 Tax=Azospira inquinata TaxID=2785627 RepID=A0A975XVK9_9RHOO|nr:hypothetical protein [Azospira inquinata]QWT47425.1 hypothetical protein J8L76_06940 [Azospira inquinata]QWT49952.1 hypothetical protein Azoinq_04940 [Azospira inquinata]